MVVSSADTTCGQMDDVQQSDAHTFDSGQLQMTIISLEKKLMKYDEWSHREIMQ